MLSRVLSLLRVLATKYYLKSSLNCIAVYKGVMVDLYILLCHQFDAQAYHFNEKIGAIFLISYG